MNDAPKAERANLIAPGNARVAAEIRRAPDEQPAMCVAVHQTYHQAMELEERLRNLLDGLRTHLDVLAEITALLERELAG